MNVSTLWSLSLSVIIVGVIVMIQELKNNVQRELSAYLTLIGSLIAVLALILTYYEGEASWFDLIVAMVMLNGIRIDLKTLRSRRK